MSFGEKVLFFNVLLNQRHLLLAILEDNFANSLEVLGFSGPISGDKRGSTGSPM